MTAIDTRIAALEARIARLEDELAIRNLMVRYGMAADTGDADRTAAVFTKDGVYDVDGRPAMEGRAQVREMVLGPHHQALVPSCAHTVGPLAVELDGNRAVAFGYSRTYTKAGDEIGMLRVAANRIELARSGGRWQIVRRTNRMIGHEEASKLLQQGLTALDG
jgi:uncharacterized protein (TIGR02246 family)